MKKTWIILFMAAATIELAAQPDECTIGVACGRATADGRPMVWKTRDYESEPDNEVKYITIYDYKFIAVTNAGNSTSSWMGVNEYGLAIVNSNSTDLPDGSSTGPGNGTFMSMALGSCKTVDELQALLDATNSTGRTTNANFAAIDTTGAAAIFETGNTVYWRYDAEDEPNGYVLRTNFAINGGGSSGTERLIRSVKLIGDFYNGDSLNHKSILRHQMRDFSNANSQPVPIPFNGTWGGNPHGYIETSVSICRYSSVSAAVIHGTLPGEPAKFSTLWGILGQPATSIAVPYWPIGYTPHEANGLFTAELCDVANQIRTRLFDLANEPLYLDTYKLLDGEGNGLWTRTFPYEDRTLARMETLMEEWRSQPAVPIADMKTTEDTLANKTYEYLLGCLSYLSAVEQIPEEAPFTADIYPNPFTDEAVLSYEVNTSSEVLIEVYSLTGVMLDSALIPSQPPGSHRYVIGQDQEYPAGMLLVRIRINGYSRHLKLIRK